MMNFRAQRKSRVHIKALFLTIFSFYALAGLQISEATAQSQHPERRGLSISKPDQGQTMEKGFYKIELGDGIRIERSLLVNNETSLKKFSVERILNQLAKQSGDPRLRAGDILQKIVKPILCINSETRLPVVCDMPNHPALKLENYKVIAVVNRFDLADKKQLPSCGEYRIVVALMPGGGRRAPNTTTRLLINFEFGLPNPDRFSGLGGCSPITKLWAKLSDKRIAREKRDRLLVSFFHDGIPSSNVGPAISIDNLGASNHADRGQIRTNQEYDGRIWVLREFKAAKKDDQLIVKQAPTKGVPKPHLFGKISDTDEEDLAALAKAIAYDIENLSKEDINKFSFRFPDELLVMENFSSGHDQDKGDILKIFQDNMGDNSSLREKIERALQTLPGKANLKPHHIAARITALTCAGCHHFSSRDDLGGQIGKWPPQGGFVHIREDSHVSTVLRKEFLPHRKKIFVDHLNKYGYP